MAQHLLLIFVRQLIILESIFFPFYFSTSKGDSNAPYNQPPGQEGECPKSKIQVHTTNISKYWNAIKTILWSLESGYDMWKVVLTLTACTADSVPRSSPAMRTTSSFVVANSPTTKYLYR